MSGELYYGAGYLSTLKPSFLPRCNCPCPYSYGMRKDCPQFLKIEAKLGLDKTWDFDLM